MSPAETASGQSMVASEANHVTLPVSLQETHKVTREGLWLTTASLDASNQLRASFGLPKTTGSARLAELMEVQRQAGIAHAHRAFNVPFDHTAILNEIELHADKMRPPNAVVGQVDVAAKQAQAAGAKPPRMLDQRFRIHTPSGLGAQGTTRARFVPKRVYERLRLTASEPSPSLQHGDASGGNAQLPWEELPFLPDINDPVLTDHGADHVSAMSLVCAVEAIVDNRYGPLMLASLRVEFTRYAELSPQPVIRFQESTEGVIEGMLLQSGSLKATFSGTVTLSTSNNHHQGPEARL